MIQVDGDEFRVTPDMVVVGEDWWVALRAFVEQSTAAGKTVVARSVVEGWSPVETGKLLGLSRASVLRRINSGSLRAVRVGSRWLVPAVEVARYRRAEERGEV